MSVDVRRLRTDGEFEQYLRAAIYSFNSNASRDESQLERYQRLYRREWCLGAFDGGDLIAGMTVIPFEQHMLGARIPLGGVATVASLPERRRSGAVGALLRTGLREMRDAGQPLSGLYTPHYSLYRRFGWEIAFRMLAYSFSPKAMQTKLPRPEGTLRRIRVDAWEDVDRLYSAFVAGRNGALVRDEERWRSQVFSQELQGEHDAVVWRNAGGEDRGYAVYTQQHRQNAEPWGETTLRVLDFVALDGEAYSAVLNYLMSHDLVDRIVLVVSEDEPVLAAFEEPVHFKQPVGSWPGMMLRVVDVQAAFDARPAPVEASGLSVTVAVEDGSAEWNSGCWRLASGEGRITAERIEGGSQLDVEAGALGALYNGFLSPEAAARVGMLRVHDGEAVEALRRLLATPMAPFCNDDF